MEEKNIKKEPKSFQLKIKLRTLIIIAVIIVVLLATNVFAGIMGYENIFFAIKNLVTTESANGKDEIFSDKEITISYASIEILDNVKLQVNKLQIRENNSTLVLKYTDKRKNKTEISLELLDSENESLSTKVASDGEIQMNADRQIDETEELTLVVKSDGVYVKSLLINLETREISVDEEDEIENDFDEEENKSNTENDYEDENTSTTDKSTSYTEKQIESALSNYLELRAYAGCDALLENLTLMGEINYDSSKDKESSPDDGTIVTSVKFSDYKNAMLNFVSESEFEENWTSSIYYNENSDGYLTKLQGGGDLCVYTINSITKINNSTYSAKTTSAIADSGDYSEDDTFTFTITSYNGNCVIDSLE